MTLKRRSKQPGADVLQGTLDMLVLQTLRLGPAQYASNDFVQGRARAEQELGLEGPDRHLYERAPIGYVAYSSCHTRYRDGNSGANVISE